jgi:hypothetical protein
MNLTICLVFDVVILRLNYLLMINCICIMTLLYLISAAKILALPLIVNKVLILSLIEGICNKK